MKDKFKLQVMDTRVCRLSGGGDGFIGTRYPREYDDVFRLDRDNASIFRAGKKGDRSDLICLGDLVMCRAEGLGQLGARGWGVGIVKGVSSVV